MTNRSNPTLPVPAASARAQIRLTIAFGRPNDAKKRSASAVSTTGSHSLHLSKRALNAGAALGGGVQVSIADLAETESLEDSDHSSKAGLAARKLEAEATDPGPRLLLVTAMRPKSGWQPGGRSTESSELW